MCFVFTIQRDLDIFGLKETVSTFLLKLHHHFYVVCFKGLIKLNLTMICKRAFSTSTIANYYDIVINGGGMIGSVLACKLAKNAAFHDLSILLVESEPEKNWDKELVKESESFSNRVSSLNENTKDLLQRTDVWETVRSISCRHVSQMKVWNCGSNNIATTFEIDDAKTVENLAYIVENHILIAAAMRELRILKDKVHVLHNNTITKYNLPTSDNENVKICLNDGSPLECGLLLGTDGANSKVRQAMGVQYISWNYSQRAVVATLRISQDGTNTTAWQKFLPNGPVALLPLADDVSSLVWTTTPDHAKTLSSLSNESFTDALNTILFDDPVPDAFTSSFSNAVSQVFKSLKINEKRQNIIPPAITDVVENSRSSFPLGFGHAVNYVSPRVALIGDAAHRVHPLAGQGVNLGFADVSCFDYVLEKHHSFGEKLGSLHCLKEYETNRQRRNVPKLIAIDLIQKIAGHQWPPLLAATNVALQISDAVPQIKKYLINSAAV